MEITFKTVCNPSGINPLLCKVVLSCRRKFRGVSFSTATIKILRTIYSLTNSGRVLRGRPIFFRLGFQKVNFLGLICFLTATHSNCLHFFLSEFQSKDSVNSNSLQFSGFNSLVFQRIFSQRIQKILFVAVFRICFIAFF
jgi:hypothetical protein